MHRLSLLVCWLALGLLFAGAPATAQNARTLDIHDGRIYIDGRAVPEDQLPPSLDLSGVEARFQFVGVQRPVVEIGDQLFAVNETLEPVSEDEVRGQQASVILWNSSPRGLAPARVSEQGRSEETGRSGASRSERSLDIQAAQQEYLSEIQRRHRSLYERLMRERQMEAETHQLARVIRLLPDGPERQSQIDTLRATLNEIFDLKQENRRREIEALQQQIMELQRSLKQREDMREAMIERRIQQLVGSTVDPSTRAAPDTTDDAPPEE